MKGFKNAKVYIRGRGVIRTDIAVENGVIRRIGDLPELQPVFDTGDCLLTAGFIDEHIHGAGGCDTMDGTASALSTISRALAKEGVTAFLATTMTQSRENITRALKAAAAFKADGGAELIGVHLEGPFISRKYLGAQKSEFVAAPAVEYFSELQQAAGGKIKLVTIAPEEGGEELIKALVAGGVVPSVGHSAATFAQVDSARKLGLSCVTHTFNAQSPFNHREAGVAGAALSCDDLFCEVIADTVHVSVPALKLLLKNKPDDKIVLITDAIRAKGLGDGLSELGGQTVFVEGGQARLADGTLAGSVLKMNVAVRNLVEKCGVEVTRAIDFASYNPAKNLGVLNERGRVAEGLRADFALIDDKFNVKAAFVGGEKVFND